MLTTAKKLSIGIAALIFLVCFSLYFQHDGFDQGLLAVTQSSVTSVERVASSIHWPRTYQFFAGKYFLISLLLIIFLISKIGESKRFANIWSLGIGSQLVSVTSLVVIILQFGQILTQKSIREEDLLLGETYDRLLLSSLPYDRICLIGVIFLLTVQVIALLIYLSRRGRIGDEEIEPRSTPNG